MEPEINQEDIKQEVKEKSSLHTVTPLSKYLAIALFITLPFVGGWIGYQYAPEKIVEVEKVIEVEKIVEVERSETSSDTEEVKVTEVITEDELVVKEFYLESFACDSFAGEFCSTPVEIDGRDLDCFLATYESGMTLPYTKEGLLLNCRE